MAALNRNPDLILSKVPAVTLTFWIIKIAATTLGRDRRRHRHHDAQVGVPGGDNPLSRSADRAGHRADPREEVSSLLVLGDYRRLDRLRHDDGLFRPIARVWRQVDFLE